MKFSMLSNVFPSWLRMVKNLPANVGDTRDVSSIPESGRSLEEEMATQYSCLRNPMTEEPDGLESIGSQRVLLSMYTCMPSNSISM